jgi:hypothetical protein
MLANVRNKKLVAGLVVVSLIAMFVIVVVAIRSSSSPTCRIYTYAPNGGHCGR